MFLWLVHMNVVICNDTSKSTHFGCYLVMDAIYDQLKRINANVIKRFYLGQGNITIPEKTDLILVNGEGSVHHGRNPQLVNVASRYKKIPSVFFNAVWEKNPEWENLKSFRLVAVRESLSLKQLPSFVKGEVVPDVAFISPKLINFKPEKPKRGICLTDNVVKPKDANNILKAKNWKDSLLYIKEMSKYKKVCTGRHHGVCVAASLGIPFSAWPSNTHKILGMMSDMGIRQHHYNTEAEAFKNIPEVIDPKVLAYVQEAKFKIVNFFDNLKNII